MAEQTAVTDLQGFMRIVWRRTARRNQPYIKLYRGQPDEKPLLPALFRPPNDPFLIQDVERKLLTTFQNESPYLLPSRPDNDWDWLSLGQHFGLRTRLLDWTANPLTALFFAVEKDSKAPTVYIYRAAKKQIVTDKEKDSDSPFDIEETRIMQPSWHSIRVAMQAGWHTVHKIYEMKDGDLKFRPLQDMTMHDERTSSINIDPKAIPKIRAQLVDMGIKQATVYGDLQSVSAAIGTALGVG